MVFNIVGVRILRVTLAMTVIVDYQIAREPHQPIRQITLFGVVLFERFENADENFLRQIFRLLDARRETVGEIEDSPRKRRNDFFPSRAVARPTTPHKVCARRAVAFRNCCCF